MSSIMQSAPATTKKKKKKKNPNNENDDNPQQLKNQHLKHSQIPPILESVWSECTPADLPLRDQVTAVETIFLIKYAQLLLDKSTAPFEKNESFIDEILDVTKSKVAVLMRQVSPAITHAVMAVVLRLLSNLIDKDFFKYKTVEDMLEVYPTFADRSDKEKENLLSTANWMSVLFRVIPARKNKGIAMDIVPKFVEGNSAHYVTGGGQSSATTDRVVIYETEGGYKASKRKRQQKREMAYDEGSLLLMEASRLIMNEMMSSQSLGPLPVPTNYIMSDEQQPLAKQKTNQDQLGKFGWQLEKRRCLQNENPGLSICDLYQPVNSPPLYHQKHEQCNVSDASHCDEEAIDDIIVKQEREELQSQSCVPVLNDYFSLTNEGSKDRNMVTPSLFSSYATKKKCQM